MRSHYDIHLVATLTHGRVLVREARGAALGVLVGFHGYMETADIQMQRLEAIPDASLNALAGRLGRVRAHEFDGGHEWNGPVSVAAADFLLSV